MPTAKRYRSINLLLPALTSFVLINNTVEAQMEIRPGILNITYKLEKENIVYFGFPVGFSGEPETGNKYCKLYKRLKSKATNDELTQLTKSKSAPIVVYAFDILQERNYEGLKTIFLNHVNDTTWFWTAGGCTGIIDRVNWFMLKRLKPTDHATTNGLTRSEYELYCSRFKAEDKLFSCN